MSAEASFFLHADWFALLRQHGQLGPAHHVAVRDHRGQVRADLPLLQHSGGHWRSFSNYYSPDFGLAWYGEPGCASEVDWDGLVSGLAGCSGLATLQLQPFEREGAFAAAMMPALARGGWWCDAYFCFGNWYLPLPEGTTFDAFWRTRSSQLRNTVERARKRLTRAHAWHTEVISAPGAALDRGIDAYQQVYAESWKPQEPHAEFMPALMRMAAGKGQLRLGLLWCDGRAIAAQVWLLADRKASIYKLAYVQAQERLSPGSVLTADMFRHVIDETDVAEIDYLMGDEPYKSAWMSHRREFVGIVAFRRARWRAWWPWARHLAGCARRWWRQQRGSQSRSAVNKA